MKNDRRFIAMPPAVMSDQLLSAADFRILATIANHDRMSGNGRGCFASTSTIAQEACCGLRTAERSIQTLIGLGYLRSERSRSDGRRKILRVNYPEIPAKSAGEFTRDPRQSDPEYPPTHFELRDTEQGLTPRNQKSKQILLNREAYAENLRHSARSDANSRPISIETKIALIDRHKKSVSVEDLFRAVTFLQETIDQLGDDPNDRICGWAQRVLEDVHEELYRCGAA